MPTRPVEVKLSSRCGRHVVSAGLQKRNKDVSCGETWTPETVGILIEHIRWENGDLEEITA